MTEIDCFKKTREFRLIKYSITKIPFISCRIDFLRKLGFKTTITQTNDKEKTFCGRFFYDKNKRLRIQISDINKNNTKIYWSVICG